MSITTMTELDAINDMLEAIYESPVNSLNSDLVEATDALRLLRKTSRSVQKKGYPFNTYKSHTLEPDINGLINLPSNTLKVDTTGVDKARDVVMVGKKLVDRDNNNTSKFATSLTVELVLGLDFEDLPIAAQEAITKKACRLFQQAKLGSIDQGRVDAADEETAMAELEDAEGESADYNIL